MSVSKLFKTVFSSALLLLSCSANSAERMCLKEFESLKTLVHENYAGYTDKANGDSERFNSLTNEVIESINRGSDLECNKHLQRWLDFFKDPHMRLIVKGKN